MPGPVEVYGADVVTSTALEAIERGQQLLNANDWGTVVGHTPGRVIYRDRAEHPYCQRQWIRGRVKGERDPLMLLHLLSDHSFKKSFDHDIRDVHKTQTVVSRQLWVQREVIDLNAPLVADRECIYLTAQAELGGGTRLLVEAPLPGDEPQGGAVMVRARRFCAWRLAPVEGTDEVELTMVCEVHLGGNVPEAFQESYLDARTELIESVNQFVAQPSWPAKREQLEHSGPRLRQAPKSSHSAPNSGKAARWRPESMSSSPPSSPNGPGAVAAVPPTTSDQSRSINQMLHLAQVHTFANLNSGREATDMAFIEGLIQSRQLAAEETRQPRGVGGAQGGAVGGRR